MLRAAPVISSEIGKIPPTVEKGPASGAVETIRRASQRGGQPPCHEEPALDSRLDEVRL
jgi:hypothetical protein